MLRPLLCAALLAQAAASPAPPYLPAQLRSGAPPAVSIQAVGGGEVLLELSISRDGDVTGVKTLRATPPFTDALSAAARGWQFLAAEQEVEPPRGAPPVSPRPRERVDSTVLAAGVFLPPTLNTLTFAVPPKDTALPSSPETPYPISTTRPLFPPRALASGVVVVEVRVTPEGRVADASVVSSAPPFDQPALDAARQWTFRPGRVRGVAVEKFAYIAFAFRQPVTVQ
jgi:TonB family protein